MKIWAKILTISILGLSLIGCGGGSKGTSALGERSFIGSLSDEAGNPIVGARVSIVEPFVQSETDESGNFSFSDVAVQENTNLFVEFSEQEYAASIPTPDFQYISLALTITSDGSLEVEVSDATGSVNSEHQNETETLSDPLRQDYSNSDDIDDSTPENHKKNKGKKLPPQYINPADINTDNAQVQIGTEENPINAGEVASQSNVQKFDFQKPESTKITPDTASDISLVVNNDAQDASEQGVTIAGDAVVDTGAVANTASSPEGSSVAVSNAPDTSPTSFSVGAKSNKK